MGDVEALVEDVDRAYDLERAVRQLAQAVRARSRGRAAMDGYRALASRAEERGHEVGVLDGAAEAQRAPRACAHTWARALLVLGERLLGPVLGGHRGGQCLRVELATG